MTSPASKTLKRILRESASGPGKTTVALTDNLHWEIFELWSLTMRYCKRQNT